MLESLFSILGVTKIEVKIYVALAELGKAPASLLAKNLNLPRSTVYTSLDNLEKRGLITKDNVADIAMYRPNSTESIRKMVRHEKIKTEQQLIEKEKAGEKLIPLLNAHFKNKNFSIPNLEFFEGKVGIETMLYRYESIWQQSIANHDYTWWGYQDHHFVENYRDWLEHYWASMKESEVIRLFSNKSNTESKLKTKIVRRTIKTIDNKNQFSSTIWVLGDYVVTIMTRQQPHYAFQLQDAVFAANQRIVFQMLWRSAK